MNVLFVSHCDFQGNSAMHIYSIANVLADLGLHCAVCVPNDPTTINAHGESKFGVVSYDDAYLRGVTFPNGNGPDLVHAWTPRELVRKLTQHLTGLYGCPYLIHLEDNEEVVLENEINGLTYEALCRLPIATIDAKVGDNRSHPVRSREFLAGAAGVTALMDKLLEFAPPDLPTLVFWPGFDSQFLGSQVPDPDLRRSYGANDEQTILVYNGNVHESNASEVQSLFLAVQALRRLGHAITILKTGWNYVADKQWILDAVQCGAVKNLGFLPRAELRTVLSVADILVQPGKSDRFNDYRFPSKLPEFFASGKPVILPRANVGRSLRDGVDALILYHGNAIEIAEKVVLLMEDPRLAVRIGAAGKVFALSRLMWSKNIPPLKHFYSEILAQTKVVPMSLHAASDTTPVKLIAFYLPQFHPIRENNEFWGKGFTEWTNVTRAEPNFEGHIQPRLPADLGFYDLRVPEVLAEQARLAGQYGIHGFCFYYYWFAGRRVLERPLDLLLGSGKPDFPFCICWANENWTRNWDGAHEQVLIEQDYSGDNCERFIRDVIPILRDPRYIRVQGAPMLLVYRVNLLPDPVNTARRWREICAEAGVPAVHLCAVQSFGIDDPRQYGFDAAVEFPPHTKRALLDAHSFPGIRPDFEGYLEDYPTVVENQLAMPRPAYPLYRGAMPSWDNTPRRGTKAHILVGATTEIYERWLSELVRQSLDSTLQEPIVFINSWNEWAEGAHLEPDQPSGHSRLSATLAALRKGSSEFVARPETIEIQPASGQSAALDLQSAVRRYARYPVKDLSYGTVQDYCESFDNLLSLATANGDLKDLQRPWTLKAILSQVHKKGRIVEIGAGEPMIADLLQQFGHEVWIVDPYDGSGNGPTAFEQYRAKYPKLKFIRSIFDDRLAGLAEKSLDCVYSISVLEHVPRDLLSSLFAGMRRFLKPDGVTIHAIDHVHRGNGAIEHLENLRRMIDGFGLKQANLDRLLTAMNDDVETYYLSAESHNRWRAGVPYHDFPMRACVSIQIATDAARLA